MKSRKKWPHLKKKSAISPCHKSIKTWEKLHELCYELLPHPPYSPDLAHSDLFLFVYLKRMFAGKKFSTNEEGINHCAKTIVPTATDSLSPQLQV
jgi:hypothetical protein